MMRPVYYNNTSEVYHNNMFVVNDDNTKEMFEARDSLKIWWWCSTLCSQQGPD